MTEQFLVLLGGIPIVLPIIKKKELIEDYIKIIDGLLITGGEDISPLFYGENPINEIGTISINRDDHEMDLFKSAYERCLPIMGICRGMQLINVALGGTLYQDISKQVEGALGHRSRDKSLGQAFHKVNIIEESKLYTMLSNKEIEVNSFHHQSIKKIGKDLKTVAYSYDGIVEGIESVDSSFVLGMQWHPEKMIFRYPVFQEIFDIFVNACK